MTIHPTSTDFKENAHRALHDPQLQQALHHVRSEFIEKRAKAAAACRNSRRCATARGTSRPTR